VGQAPSAWLERRREQAVTIASLARDVFGYTFQNPFFSPQAAAGIRARLDGVSDLDALSGIVTKAVSLGPPRQPASPGGGIRQGMLNRSGSPIPDWTGFAGMRCLAGRPADRARIWSTSWAASRVNR
jgi:hypothetical protein